MIPSTLLLNMIIKSYRESITLNLEKMIPIELWQIGYRIVWEEDNVLDKRIDE
jgi:hypothetical protein